MSEKAKQMLLLSVLFILAVVFWDTMLIYPIKLFVVMFHELSHGIAAIAFGGSILSIEISPQIGGSCIYTIPQSKLAQIVVAGSGYIGSMIWGGIILSLTSRLKRKRTVTFMIGVLSILLLIFIIRSGQIFGILFCIGFGAFMFFTYRYFDEYFHDYMLKFLGLTSCMYVIIDIVNDLILQSGIGSDADQIAKLLGVPSIFIGILCISIAFIILWFFLKLSLHNTRKKFSKTF